MFLQLQILPENAPGRLVEAVRIPDDRGIGVRTLNALAAWSMPLLTPAEVCVEA